MPCESAQKKIAEIYSLKEVDDCIAKFVAPELRQDFKQELFLILLEINPETIEKSGSEFKYYVVRIIINLVNQQRNVFHKKYLNKTVVYNSDLLKYTSSSPADIDTMAERIQREKKEDEMAARLQDIDKEIGNNGYPFYREMVRLFFKFGSKVEISRQTGIPNVTVHRTLKRVREQLRK